MVQVLILIVTLSLSLGLLGMHSYQQTKLAQGWAAHLELRMQLEKTQNEWLRHMDAIFELPVLTPNACKVPPCLLETQAIETFMSAPLSFWQHTPLALYRHQTYAIFEVLPCKATERCVRGTFVAVNEQGMQIRSQLVAQQNFGQISIRFEVNS